MPSTLAVADYAPLWRPCADAEGLCLHVLRTEIVGGPPDGLRQDF